MKSSIPLVVVLTFGGILSAVILFFLFLIHSFHADLRKQQMRIEAVRPLFDTVVTKQIRIGDSVDDVKRTLTNAGLSFSEHKQTLHSLYYAGGGCGISLQVTFDASRRVVKIDVQPQMTGL
ncbi:MAG: hypothetical protein ACRC2R_09545 [Xenococcaceae cyanobacterium]